MTRAAARARPREVAAELAAVRLELAEMRQLIEARLPAPDGDLISTTTAGRLIGKSAETLRRWALLHGIGTFSPAGDCYLISKQRLREYLLKTTGEVPSGLG
jgi:hypothetical protein